MHSVDLGGDRLGCCDDSRQIAAYGRTVSRRAGERRNGVVLDYHAHAWGVDRPSARAAQPGVDADPDVAAAASRNPEHVPQWAATDQGGPAHARLRAHAAL